MNRGRCRLKMLFPFRDSRGMLVFKCVKPGHNHSDSPKVYVEPEVLYDRMLSGNDALRLREALENLGFGRVGWATQDNQVLSEDFFNDKRLLVTINYQHRR